MLRRRVLWWCVALLLSGTLLAGCGGAAASPPPTPTLTAQEETGLTVFTRDCAACHTLVADTVKVGPPLHDIAERAATRVPGSDARSYILKSILNPDAYVVDGFESSMPKDLGKKLTGEELDAVLAFLLTQDGR